MISHKKIVVNDLQHLYPVEPRETGCSGLYALDAGIHIANRNGIPEIVFLVYMLYADIIGGVNILFQ